MERSVKESESVVDAEGDLTKIEDANGVEPDVSESESAYGVKPDVSESESADRVGDKTESVNGEVRVVTEVR